MKNLYPISHKSAVQFWRNGNNKELLKNLTLKKRKLVDLPEEYICPARYKAASQFHSVLGIEYPVIFVQPSVNDFRQSKNIKNVIRPKGLPRESFVLLDKGVLVASPEYCFLSMAKTLTIENLVELANNICSMYLHDNNSEHSQISIEPMCSVSAIEEYLSGDVHINGIKKARIAIKYAVDNSNSPVESKIATIFIIPRCRGGYGIPKMKLNYMVSLSKKAAALVGRDTLMVDMCWPEHKVIVEYDSDETHLSSSQHEYDKARVNALQESGYKVITITKKDLFSVNKLDAIVKTIINSLGLAVNNNLFEKYYDKRKEVLCNLFYNY